MKNGRKLKLNEKIILLLEQGTQLGLSIKLSCQHAGISTASYFAWMSRGEKEQEKDTIFSRLYNKIKKAESAHALANLAIIQKAAKEKTWQAAAWLLERRHPEYRMNHEQVIEINLDNSQISVVQLINEIKSTDNQINDLLQIPVIDLDEE